jgi:Cft2 family RNA processing exonuclease
MNIPKPGELASPAVLNVVARRLHEGEQISEEELIGLLPKLGYWGHVKGRHPDPGIQDDINEGMSITNLWDRFDEMDPDRRWLFANRELLARHPAAQGCDRLSNAALVSINPHMMMNHHGESIPSIGIDFIGLGGCDRIGASCYAYKIGGDVILVDVGIDPNSNQLPSFELLPRDWISRLRGIVLTHLHADHAAGLLRFEPFFNRLDKLYIPRDLPIYCTQSTGLIFSDVLRMSAGEETWRLSDPMSTISGLSDRLQPVPAGAWHTLGNCSFKLIEYPHVPGSALIEFESQGGRLLHAVDYAASRSLGGHDLDLSWLQTEGIDVVTLESTYGQIETGGHWRQLRLPQLFKSFVDLLGKDLEDTRNRVLFPAFSLGRAQELGDILEEQIPGSTIMDGAAGHLSILMRQKIPSWKQQIVNQRDYLGYRNVVASHGWMLEGSASHSYYEMLNGSDLVVFTGYIKPNTPAARAQRSRADKPRVASLPMSAHASLSQLLALVEASGAGKIVLVHGGAAPARGVDLSIDTILRERQFQVHRPKRGEKLVL